MISHPSHFQGLSHISLHLTGKTTKSISRGTLAMKVRLERNLVTFFSLKGILKEETSQNLHNFQTVSDCLRLCLSLINLFSVNKKVGFFCFFLPRFKE